MNTETTKTHRWDGIHGTAPFKFLGYFESKYQAVPGAPDCPIQPGSSCDCCGQGIMYVCRFIGSGENDKEFKTGMDCAERASMAEGNMKLVRQISAVRKAHENALKEARKQKVSASLEDLLADPVAVAKLKTLPHPLGWRAAQGDTRLDWATWMIEHCGAAGKKKLLKDIQSLLK